MRLIFSIVFTLLVSGVSECQIPKPSKIQNQSTYTDTSAVNFYSRFMDHNYDLINGREYLIYHKLNQPDPFFKSVPICDGTVYSNGRRYNDYKIMYDIYKDELVVNYLNPTGYLKLVWLNRQSVDSFEIKVNNITTRFQTFIFPAGSNMKNGFYEVAFRGKTRLLVKHLKTYSKINGRDEYYYAINRYLNINGDYYPVKSLSKFCKLFGDRKTEIRKYIRLLRVASFRRISDIELLQILEYYEMLK